MKVYLFDKDKYSLMQVNNFSIDECNANSEEALPASKFDEYADKTKDFFSKRYWLRTVDELQVPGGER